MIAAVVPVKSLEAPKSRMRPRLDTQQVRQLTLAMLCDLLETLLAVPALDRVVVATPDPALAEAARQAGAEALERADAGLNAAVDAACAELAPRSGDAALTVLGDVAGATPEDVARLLAAAPARGAVLAPSRDGGTAALLRRPANVFPAGFGPGSAKVHRELAERAGVTLVELPLPSLALDLDEPDDLEAFLAGESGGPRTRALLARIGVGA